AEPFQRRSDQLLASIGITYVTGNRDQIRPGRGFDRTGGRDYAIPPGQKCIDDALAHSLGQNAFRQPRNSGTPASFAGGNTGGEAGRATPGRLCPDPRRDACARSCQRHGASGADLGARDAGRHALRPDPHKLFSRAL
nr:hypothetical protein [Tanacetum cinerariifolium]